ncbi:hypothetical protein E2C01_036841 [Portunus trituberculatus]|uniref:Uncharacterized protein n=1 Tax=Portunus trituberculatus TaxID=210409 RepID=A0A5B7F7R6_PORTR|nr:hypothetical protein [Portunus trituberculatus]
MSHEELPDTFTFSHFLRVFVPTNFLQETNTDSFLSTTTTTTMIYKPSLRQSAPTKPRLIGPIGCHAPTKPPTRETRLEPLTPHLPHHSPVPIDHTPRRPAHTSPPAIPRRFCGRLRLKE